jgi:hypothetical protein
MEISSSPKRVSAELLADRDDFALLWIKRRDQISYDPD